MMEYLGIALFWYMQELAVWFLEGIKLIEADETVWYGAFFGSLTAAMCGPPRSAVKLVGYFFAGIGFSIGFVKAVDHFEPFMESFASGLGSGGAIRLIIDGFAPAFVDPIMRGFRNGTRAN